MGRMDWTEEKVGAGIGVKDLAYKDQSKDKLRIIEKMKPDIILRMARGPSCIILKMAIRNSKQRVGDDK